MSRERRKADKANTATDGQFSGKLPVIKGKLTQDQIDSLTDETAPIGAVKDFREGKFGK